MTISESWGKFKAELKHHSCIGYRTREVELEVTWISCGVFQVEYRRPRDAEKDYVMVGEDWYPPDAFISFTPEQFEKVAELYPGAPKPDRSICYKPFYEDFDTSRGMFDMGDDHLFQAYKDPQEGEDRVYLVTRHFTYGEPEKESSVLGLKWTDFLRLKELLDSKKDQIFYSGCKISGTLLSNLQNALTEKPNDGSV